MYSVSGGVILGVGEVPSDAFVRWGPPTAIRCAVNADCRLEVIARVMAIRHSLASAAERIHATFARGRPLSGMNVRGLFPFLT